MILPEIGKLNAPAQQTSPEDEVYFPDILISDMAKISELAGKAGAVGTMTVSDFHQFRILCFETEWFNEVRYVDGR